MIRFLLSANRHPLEMAAGRGEFFRSFLEGLQRQPAQRVPETGQPNRGRGSSRPGGRFPGQGRGFSGQRRKEGQRKVSTRSSGSETEASSDSGPPKKGSHRKSSPCKLNLLESLPSEILVKILSYLDPSSLFCLSHVSRLLHRLSNDDVLWQRIYTSEFGSRNWKLKTSEKCVEGEDCLTSRWKRLYFKSMAGQELIKWRKPLKDISPYTGLPRQTEWALSLNVSWELTLCERLGQEHTLEQSQAHFFESSVIVHWSDGIHMKFHHITTIQLHGVRKEPQSSIKTTKPNWRSLILKLDTGSPFLVIGKDKLIKMLLLQPGVIFGVWRGKNQVAFIMISLHFHKLVEKSLLGSPACPYSEPVELPPVDDVDPELGLHGYSLHFVLHNTGTVIMSGRFQQLFCHKAQIQHGLVKLKVIQRSNLSQHRSLSGSIRLPWRHEDVKGAVENCCIMSLTLLDEFQKPFWCVSTPIHITMAKTAISCDYSGHDFQMLYRNADGEVKMLLVWLEEQKQFFLIGLTVCLPVAKVNKRFNREY
ncbi:F-box only protein 15-like isoform X2 [Xiphophorus couchianus]|uniref:F-box only protein 15-like isoform X2 n=1 Tax=Xiphophorus couchianus TaxID=32473 RepID=UPI0010168D3C|nr:F-box only protein 15-like isoform X2 [Xiphophorus couchianus]